MGSTASTLDPADLRRALNDKGYMRQVDMAAGLKVGQATLSQWLTGKNPIPAWMENALAGLPRFKATKK